MTGISWGPPGAQLHASQCSQGVSLGPLVVFSAGSYSGACGHGSCAMFLCTASCRRWVPPSSGRHLRAPDVPDRGCRIPLPTLLAGRMQNVASVLQNPTPDLGVPNSAPNVPAAEECCPSLGATLLYTPRESRTQTSCRKLVPPNSRRNFGRAHEPK